MLKEKTLQAAVGTVATVGDREVVAACIACQ